MSTWPTLCQRCAGSGQVAPESRPIEHAIPYAYATEIVKYLGRFVCPDCHGSGVIQI